MILASIDLGSNSVILLIMNYDPSTWSIISVNECFQTPRISEYLSKSNTISSSAIVRLENILTVFDEQIKASKCEHILVSATNAFRVATNGEQLKKRLEEKYGWNIKILSGNEEARITFLGTINPSFTKITSILIDIGGGSTEVVFGNVKEVFFRHSLQLGVVSLKEQFMNKNNEHVELVEEIQKYIHTKFMAIKDKIPLGVNALAVAGTPTTISAIVHNVNDYSDDLIDGSELTIDQIKNVRTNIQKMSASEIGEHFGLIVDGREDLLFGGCLILEGFMDYFGIKKIVVSTKGLRYGAIYNYLIENGFYNIKN